MVLVEKSDKGARSDVDLDSFGIGETVLGRLRGACGIVPHRKWGGVGCVRVRFSAGCMFCFP